MSETLVLALVAAGLWVGQAGLHAALSRGESPDGRGLWVAAVLVVVVCTGIPLGNLGKAMLQGGHTAGAAILLAAAIVTGVQFLSLFGRRPPAPLAGAGSQPMWHRLRTIYAAFWLGQVGLFWLGLLLTPWAVDGGERFWNNAAFFAATLPVVPVLVAVGTLYMRRKGA